MDQLGECGLYAKGLLANFEMSKQGYAMRIPRILSTRPFFSPSPFLELIKRAFAVADSLTVQINKESVCKTFAEIPLTPPLFLGHGAAALIRTFTHV